MRNGCNFNVYGTGNPTDKQVMSSDIVTSLVMHSGAQVQKQYKTKQKSLKFEKLVNRQNKKGTSQVGDH